MNLVDDAKLAKFKTNYKPLKRVCMKVKDCDFEYTIQIGQKMPLFRSLPTTDEIVKRLIIRGAYVQ